MRAFPAWLFPLTALLPAQDLKQFEKRATDQKALDAVTKAGVLRMAREHVGQAIRLPCAALVS